MSQTDQRLGYTHIKLSAKRPTELIILLLNQTPEIERCEALVLKNSSVSLFPNVPHDISSQSNVFLCHQIALRNLR